MERSPLNASSERRYDLVGMYCREHGLVVAGHCACPDDAVVAVFVAAVDTYRFAVVAGEFGARQLGARIIRHQDSTEGAPPP